MNVQDVEGIGSAYAEKLAAAGITTTEDLLTRGARPKGRAELAETADISPKLVLEWVNQVDLMRLDGVGTQYADLLSAAGVDSPLELARRNPTNLAATFVEIDAARPNLVRRVPSEDTVTAWVEQAKSLSRAVFHDDGPAVEGAPDAGTEAAPAAVPAAVEVAAVPEAVAAALEPAVSEPEPEPAVAEPVAKPVAKPVAAEPVAKPVVAAASVAEPVARTLTAAPAAAPEAPGLWARIKRMIGMG